MPRQPRIEFPNAIYHVMARGDRQEPVFLDAADRESFLEALAKACGMTGWKVYAWILMRNHYHLVVKTPESNLVAGMKWLQNSYTRRFNVRHKLWGHVFGGRYKSIVVEDGIYARQLVDYVHLNPVRAGIVPRTKVEELANYKWSSLARDYMAAPGSRATWMDASGRLEVAGEDERVSHRRRYLEYLEGVAQAEGKSAGKAIPEGQSLQSTLVRGWYWGSEAFREKLLELAKKKAANNVNYRSSPLSEQRSRSSAEEIVEEGLLKAGVEEKELPGLKGSHPAKVAIAEALKSRTTVGNGWIARRLAMKTAGNVSQLSRRYRKGEISLPGKLESWLKSVKNA